MENGVTATLIVTALVAFVGYLATYVTSLRLARRKDRLDRINRQLSEFYGPLYALMETTGQAWRVLEAKHNLWPNWGATPAVGRSDRFTEHEAEIWRLWIINVFSPLSRQMMEVIVNNADLIIEQAMPRCLQDICNHIVCYEPVLARWEKGPPFPLERAENRSSIYFPRGDLEQYVKSSFKQLKREQARLLAHM